MTWWWVAHGKTLALIATRQLVVRTPTTAQEDGRIADTVNSVERNVKTESVQNTECDRQPNLAFQKTTNQGMHGSGNTRVQMVSQLPAP